jgi:hypothetical protein
MTERVYTTRRNSIVSALKDLIKNSLTGSAAYPSRIGEVHSKIKFFDDLVDFPAAFIIAGNENRQYQAGGYKDRYLEVRIMVFVKEHEPLEACEKILEDIETLVEKNARISYIVANTGETAKTIDISVSSISTDEGALDPISVGEINLLVHY